MSDARIERIREKIFASQARSTGKEPPRSGTPGDDAAPERRSLFDRAIDDHPLAVLAGGILLGAVAAALVPRGSVPRSSRGKLGKRLIGLATVAAELGALYGTKAFDAAAQGARESREKLGDLGETLAEQSGDARRKAARAGAMAGKRAIDLAGVAAKNARGAGGGAIKALTDLRDRSRH